MIVLWLFCYYFQVWDYHNVPDTAELSERPKLCLTDAISHTVSADYSKLFDHKMYSMNTSLGNTALEWQFYIRILNVLFSFSVPEAIGLYEKLGVKHQPLKVIRPNFEAPLPPLQAAVSCNVLMFRIGISHVVSILNQYVECIGEFSLKVLEHRYLFNIFE